MLRRLLLTKAVLAAAITSGILACPVTAAIKLKKPSQRKRAPAFELRDVEGRAVRLSDYAGKVVLLDFWATWCGPCKSSIPWIRELADKYRDAGLVVIGINMDEDGWPVVTPFVQQFRITYPVVLATKRLAYLYGDVEALPLAFFVDRNQRVAAIHLGTANRKEFEKTINLLLEIPH